MTEDTKIILWARHTNTNTGNSVVFGESEKKDLIDDIADGLGEDVHRVIANNPQVKIEDIYAHTDKRALHVKQQKEKKSMTSVSSCITVRCCSRSGILCSFLWVNLETLGTFTFVLLVSIVTVLHTPLLLASYALLYFTE